MNHSIYDQFHDIARLYPNNICLRFERKAWTYREVDRRIIKAARRLLGMGYKKGDVIAVAMPNCPDEVYLFYAISYIGAISYNIHPLTPALTMNGFLFRAKAKALFCLSTMAYDYRQGIDSEIKIVAINPYRHVNMLKAIAARRLSRMGPGIDSYWRLARVKKWKKAELEEREDAVYLNTGGTNGAPKIVRLSSLAINHIAANSFYLIGTNYRKFGMLTAIPLFHIFGLLMGVHVPLSIGASSCLMLKFNTKEAIWHMKKGHTHIIIGVPSLYNALLSRKSFYGPHLKKQIVAFVGGDSVPQSLIERWNEAFKEQGSPATLNIGYGLTEAGVVIVSPAGHVKKGSIGTPLPGVKVKICDLETHKELPLGTPGEILIGGPSIMNGYLDSDELNKEALLDIDGEKYLSTKDYGYCDMDGFSFFKQRMRRIVKINGETLCPSDVEDATLSLKEVFDAYCYGVENERKGHVFRLLVVKRRSDEEKELTDKELEEKIYEAIAKSLPPAYRPDKIIFLPRLPRTPIGKINSDELRKMRANGLLD